MSSTQRFLKIKCLHYPYDQPAKNSFWRDNCPAQSHPTKKEGQKFTAGNHTRSFSDCQRRGLARCDHVGEACVFCHGIPSARKMQAEHPPFQLQIHFFIHSVKEFNLLTAGCLPCIALSCGNVASVLVTEDRQNKWQSHAGRLRDVVGSRLCDC